MPRTMKAAVFTQESGRHCEILDVLLADPGPNEIIIQVKASGICHTDIAVAAYQKRPAVLGHESAGIVVQIGENISGFTVGDHVVATFSSCGECGTCGDGKPAYCMDQAARNYDGIRPNGKPSITLMDGTSVFSAFFQQSGFAEYALVQADNLVKIPKDMPFELAAPLGCGIQTGAGAVINSLSAQPGQSLAVFGVGAVGLSAVMAAKAAGCAPIIAIDIDPARLKLAKTYGADYTLNGAETGIAETIKTITQGGAHFALEGTGVQHVYHTAVNCLRPAGTCGTLTLPGQFGDPVTHPGGMAFLTTRQMGIVEGDSVPHSFIPKLAAMQADGSLPYQGLIAPYAFKDINAALEACHAKTAIKPVLIFDDP